MILVFDTSVEGFSVGIFRTDGSLLDELVNPEPYAHTEFLVPSIQSLLQRAEVKFCELTQIVTTCGPGSFTGIRVGLATAAGLRAALNIPVVTVNTLSALVMSAPQCDFEHPLELHAVLDTKCGEVYHQAFECANGVLKILDDPKSISIEKLLELSNGVTIVTHPSSAGILSSGSVLVTPALLAGVLRSTNYAASNDVQPIYVRSANITQPKKHA